MAMMLLEHLSMNMCYQLANEFLLSLVDFKEYQYGTASTLIFLTGRSNQSKQLQLDETAISKAIKLHDTLFNRSYEILRSLSLERASFQSFSSWLTLMVEDVLAHEDTNVGPPLLHTVDTLKVAEYITDYLSRPILWKFLIPPSVDGRRCVYFVRCVSVVAKGDDGNDKRVF